MLVKTMIPSMFTCVSKVDKAKKKKKKRYSVNENTPATPSTNSFLFSILKNLC